MWPALHSVQEGEPSARVLDVTGARRVKLEDTLSRAGACALALAASVDEGRAMETTGEVEERRVGGCRVGRRGGPGAQPRRIFRFWLWCAAVVKKSGPPSRVHLRCRRRAHMYRKTFGPFPRRGRIVRCRFLPNAIQLQLAAGIGALQNSNPEGRLLAFAAGARQVAACDTAAQPPPTVFKRKAAVVLHVSAA